MYVYINIFLFYMEFTQFKELQTDKRLTSWERGEVWDSRHIECIDRWVI